MQSYDPGALAQALNMAVSANTGKHWQSEAAGFGRLVHLCQDVARAANEPLGTATVLVSSAAAELDAVLLRHDVAAHFDSIGGGTGIITSNHEIVGIDTPLDLVRVKGGDSLRKAMPTSTFNYLLVVSTEDPRVTVLSRGAKPPVACLPLVGGTLWLTRTSSKPEQHDLELLAEAQQIIQHVQWQRRHRDPTVLTAETQRWSHVLWPLFGMRASLEIDWLVGATHGDQQINGAFQILDITFDLRGAKIVWPPKAMPDEPQPLAFNGTTLAFKTGPGDVLQWLAKVEVGDWELHGE